MRMVAEAGVAAEAKDASNAAQSSSRLRTRMNSPSLCARLSVALLIMSESVRERDAIGKVWLTKQKGTLGEQKQEFTLNFIDRVKFPERMYVSLHAVSSRVICGTLHVSCNDNFGVPPPRALTPECRLGRQNLTAFVD